jgi:RNA polymerase sigma-70 factor (ECF subfamily)
MKKVRAWLFTITANLHKDALRKKRTRRRFLFDRMWASDQDMPVCEGSLEREDSAESAGEEKMEMGHAISRAVSNLPEQHRIVFMLKEVAGFKQSEISEILGIPLGTVKSVMFRAVKKLRMDLDAYHPKQLNKKRRGPNEMQEC